MEEFRKIKNPTKIPEETQAASVGANGEIDFLVAKDSATEIIKSLKNKSPLHVSLSDSRESVNHKTTLYMHASGDGKEERKRKSTNAKNSKRYKKPHPDWKEKRDSGALFK